MLKRYIAFIFERCGCGGWRDVICEEPQLSEPGDPVPLSWDTIEEAEMVVRARLKSRSQYDTWTEIVDLHTGKIVKEFDYASLK